ncbi:MAG TPA: hypothetical protein VE420_07635 [Gemmatimonadales bacterium]|nr:hypothetical protein [Gemmatimonadales bacterium]
MSDGQLSDGEPFSCKLAMSYGRELSQRALPKVGPQWLLPLVAVLGLGTIYVLTGPGNRSEADDAFWFADDIEHEGLRELLGEAHTAHLLFLPLARGLFNMLRLAGIDVRAYDAVRLTNCFVAATAVVLFSTLLRTRFRLSPFAAMTGAAGLAVSYGFWRYANEAEAYAVAILVIVVLCLVAFTGLPSTRSVIVASGLATLGTFIHILSVIPAVIVVPFILLLQRRIRDMAVYVLGFTLFVGVIGYGAYRYAALPQQSFAGYLLGPSPEASYSPRVIPESVVSLGQGIGTSNFLFAYPGIARRIVAAFPKAYLVEEQYAGERSDSIVRIVPLATVPLLLLLATVLVWSMRRHLQGRGLPPTIAVPLAAVAAWILAYWLVVARWSSSAPEAWIPLLPAVWILIAVVVFERARTRMHRALVVALLVVLLVHNLVGGFWMMHSRSTDFNAVKARWLLDHSSSGDVILTADGAVFERYLRYFSTAKVVSLEGLSSEELVNTYAATVRQTGRVFATAGVFDPPSQLRALDEVSFHALQQFASTVQPDFHKVFDDDIGDIYLHR